MMKLSLCVVLLAGAGLAAQTKSITEAEARAVVAKAETKARDVGLSAKGAGTSKETDPDRFRASCERGMSAANKGYEADGVVVSGTVASEHIRVRVTGPANRACDQATSLMRRLEPVQLEWTDEIRVHVVSLTVNAAPVTKVVVTRAGVVVPPLPSSTLALKQVINALGASFRVPDGWASYPRDAFAQGAVVDVTAVSDKAGVKFHRSLKDGDLRKIQ